MKNNQRELKFRAWDKDDEVMCDVKAINFDSGQVRVKHPNERFSVISHTKYFPRDAVLMQYTGLKDKNSKEIYEGDIVSIPGRDYIGVVRYDSGSYWIYDLEHQEPWFISDVTSAEKVLGNIYENEELLLEG